MLGSHCNETTCDICQLDDVVGIGRINDPRMYKVVGEETQHAEECLLKIVAWLPLQCASDRNLQGECRQLEALAKSPELG